MAILGTFEIPKLNFPKPELDNDSTKIGKTEWKTYFEWYSEASNWYKESEVAFSKTKS